jgi:hypothetical protein
MIEIEVLLVRIEKHQTTGRFRFCVKLENGSDFISNTTYPTEQATVEAIEQLIDELNQNEAGIQIEGPVKLQ